MPIGVKAGMQMPCSFLATATAQAFAGATDFSGVVFGNKITIGGDISSTGTCADAVPTNPISQTAKKGRHTQF
jgi:hypothetical protein